MTAPPFLLLEAAGAADPEASRHGLPQVEDCGRVPRRG